MLFARNGYKHDQTMQVNTIHIGDCIKGMKKLPDNSVDCCVTSPPYYGLRDYGTASWVGGDAACAHQGKPFRTKENINKNTGTGTDKKNKTDRQFYKEQCEQCGAMRVDMQIGLEHTPEAYIKKLVKVFTQVRRVLKPEGTLWVNIGDSYAASGKNRTEEQAIRKSTLAGSKRTQVSCSLQPNKVTKGLKPKDLIGIPWMLAFALRKAGWYLRQDIIWSKPNPMPESVTDRCSKSHEYIFLLSKSYQYYFDHKSIQIPGVTPAANLKSYHNPENPKYLAVPDRWKSQYNGRSYGTEGYANKRSVWQVTTKPYAEAHFATFPPDLIVDCIKAGSPRGGGNS